MTGLTSVAFGPNDSWVVCEDTDITWSSDLPTNIYNKLNGRNKNRNCAPTHVAAMGPSNTYALFFTDHNWWVNHDDLTDQLNENNIDGRDVKAISFGDNGSYLLLLHNEECYWCNVHWRLQQLIRTKNNAPVEWATIGRDDAYFISFDDGRYYWGGGIPDELNDILEQENAINKAWLSPFNDSYFVEYYDGSTEWNACESFSNNQHCTTWMNPRNILYTNGSIGREFSCGRCIYDVANELKNGNIEADDLPCMQVFDWEGNTYSLSNRRLWVLSSAGVESAPVKYVDPPDHVMSKLWNGFQGTYARVR